MDSLNRFYEKYAELIVSYCIDVKNNETILVQSTPIAEPLLKPLYKAILKAGGHCEFLLKFNEQDKIFFDNSNDKQINTISPFYKYAVKHFDAFISIRAPHDLYSLKDCDPVKKANKTKAGSETKKILMNRSQKGEARWALCEFPTKSAAKSCGMTLNEYQDFIFNACFLQHNNPKNEWQSLSKNQDKIITTLSKYTEFQFKHSHTDLKFSLKDRVWINSDGKRNMPSGEVFTSPVEDSVNGHIYFSFPTRYQGIDVEGVTLVVKDGYIENWDAKIGKEVLDQAFSIEGSRYFGEVAIGTNPNIQKATRNILFDEKIYGSIHMAIGSSYPETGGKNVSTLHWDFITNMKDGGQILADKTLIYENGKFIK